MILDGQSAFSAIGRGRPLLTNPLHDIGIKTIQSMIQQCDTNHSICRNRASGYLPQRILDLSTDDPAKGIVLRDFDSHSNLQQGTHRYMALSYRWGIGRGMPQTTVNTLNTHKKKVAWETLPRGFQEAIVLTKALNVRFLWIDSLCVIQDDPADKLRASAELDDIFGNAVLTIAATSAPDPTKGLFVPKLQTFKVQATDSKGSLSKVYVREQPSHHSFKKSFDAGSPVNDWELPSNALKEANARTPLLTRAWAFSERLLSSRILHFTDSELIYECREGFQCECGRIEDERYDPRKTDSIKRDFAKCAALQNGEGQHRRMDSVVSQLAATTLTDGNEDHHASPADPLEQWSYIVTAYTARNLTFDTDRLLAIAGVAKSLSTIINAGYIAGHWTNSTLGLLWYPNDGAHCRRPKQVPGRNVPSWSWASVEGSPIWFDNLSAMDLACSASFVSDSPDIFSPFHGHAIELRAALATEVSFHEDAPNEYSLSKSGISVEFQPDIIPPRGVDIIQSGQTVICVLVSMSFRSSILGLVLAAAGTKAPTYRRIGRFECYECLKSGSEEDPDDAEALFEHWFPDVVDMTQLDDHPRRTFKII